MNGLPILAGIARGISVASILINDAIIIARMFQESEWGIFQKGTSLKIAPYDSFQSIDAIQDNPISTYPVENGRLEAYNKVKLPYEKTIVLNKGGSVQERQEFLKAIDYFIGKPNLFDIVMPEITYTNANLVSRSWSRSENHGITNLQVELAFQEVRDTATATFSNTKNPNDAAMKSNGSARTYPIKPQAATVKATPI